MKLLLRNYSEPGNKEVFEQEAPAAYKFARFAIMCHLVSAASEAIGVYNFFYSIIPIWPVFRFLVSVLVTFLLVRLIEILVFKGIEYGVLKYFRLFAPAGIKVMRDRHRELVDAGKMDEAEAQLLKIKAASRKNTPASAVLSYCIVVCMTFAVVACSFFVSKKLSKETFDTWTYIYMQKTSKKDVSDFVGDFDKLKDELETDRDNEAKAINSELTVKLAAIDTAAEAKIKAHEKGITYWKEREERTGTVYAYQRQLLEDKIAEEKAKALRDKNKLRTEASLAVASENKNEKELENTYLALQDTLLKINFEGYAEGRTKQISWSKGFSKYLSWVAGFAVLGACFSWVFFFTFLVRAEIEPKVSVSKEFFLAAPMAEGMYLLRLKFSRALRNSIRRNFGNIADLQTLESGLLTPITERQKRQPVKAEINQRDIKHIEALLREKIEREHREGKKEAPEQPEQPEAKKNEGMTRRSSSGIDVTIVEGNKVEHSIFDSKRKSVKNLSSCKRELAMFEPRLEETKKALSKAQKKYSKEKTVKNQNSVNSKLKSYNRAVYNVNQFRAYIEVLTAIEIESQGV